MKYFFDNCISYRYAGMLQALGVDVTSLREEFHPSMKDVPLFEALRGSGIVFVSNDASQLTREREARALKEAGVTALYIGPFWGSMTFWDQATWLLRRWQKIDEFANAMPLGTCAEIKQNGKAMIIKL